MSQLARESMKLLGEHSVAKNESKVRIKMYWIIIIVCIVNIFILLFLNGFILDFASPKAGTESKTSDFIFWPSMDSEILEQSKETLLIDTPGCKILDTYTKNFNNIISNKVESFPKCWKTSFSLNGRTQKGLPLVTSDLTSLRVVESELKHYDVLNVSRINCCYRPFWRKHDARHGGDREAYFTRCIRFDTTLSTSINQNKYEFVEIKCYKKFGGDPYVKSIGKNKHEMKIHREYIEEIYRDYDAFVPEKQHVEERCHKHPSKPDEVSVVLLGIDAVSRLNMLRELPLLHHVLTSPPLSAISLLGYNKVGDNTFPNVMPILTGLAEDELRDACPWPSARHKLDPCPFIWKQFADRGYRTACGEDTMATSTFNDNRLSGFVQAPTDYYLRPYLHAAEQHIGHMSLGGVNMCIGPKTALSKILDYIEKFAKVFSAKKTFGFFWTQSLTKNLSMTSSVADKLYSQLFSNLVAAGSLNRTVVVVFSNTHTARNQDAMPAAYVSFPIWFRERFPDAYTNFKLNAKHRLTTPFDIHKTLSDLLAPGDNIKSKYIRERLTYQNITSKYKNRGISLFLPIPETRSCKHAGIAAKYCACQVNTKISTNASTTLLVAHYILDQMNSALSKYEQCARLRLAEVLGARRNFLNADDTRTNVRSATYYLTIKTMPGECTLEVPVRVILHKDKSMAAKLELLEPVRKINCNSGAQVCVSEERIQQFCQCLN